MCGTTCSFSVVHGFPSEAGGHFNFVAVPEVAGPHLGALEAASDTLGFCLYRKFALGQDTAVAACSLRRGLVRATRSLPVPPLAFSACTALLNGRPIDAQCSSAPQGPAGPPGMLWCALVYRRYLFGLTDDESVRCGLGVLLGK